MTDPVDWETARVVVEFGAGTGVITDSLLEKMSEDAKLLCFEVDGALFNKLRERIKDPRITLINDGAENLGKYLEKYNLVGVDYVISGLPLVSLPPKTRAKIVAEVLEHLKRGGKYIQLQYSLVSRKEFKSLFSEMRLGFTPLNIPPAFVYVCTK